MLIWIGFGVRLFNIQVINRLNSPQGIKVESINGFRGNFYDVNGKNLTQNLTFYRIGVHTKKISNAKNLIDELSSWSIAVTKCPFSKNLLECPPPPNVQSKIERFFFLLIKDKISFVIIGMC